MGVKGQKAWNRIHLDTDEIVRRYHESTGSVREMAAEYGVTIHTIYRRLDAAGVSRRKLGDANRGTQARENNPAWTGGRIQRGNGYIGVKVGDEYKAEHRVVAEKMLGRPLADGEVVHHENRDVADNRPENLKVFASHSDHMKHHAAQRRAALAAVRSET